MTGDRILVVDDEVDRIYLSKSACFVKRLEWYFQPQGRISSGLPTLELEKTSFKVIALAIE